MDTNLTVRDIMLALIKQDCFNVRRNIVVPNISFGFLDHEADLFLVSKSGYATEVEIKRSLSDLKADFKKSKPFICDKVYRFYYCVPDSLVNHCRDLCIENKRPISGIISYNESGSISFHNRTICDSDKQWPRYSGGRKLFIEEQLQIARLGTIRFWNLMNKQEHYEK